MKEINLENSSYEEVLLARDRAATKVEYRRLDFFGLLYRGFDAEEAMHTMLVSRSSYYRWVKLFNEQGLSGLTPKRSPGRPPKIDDDTRCEIIQLLQEPEKVGEYHWTAIKLHGYLKEASSIEFSYSTLVRCLHQSGVKHIVPRRKPLKQDPELRKQFVEDLNALYQDEGNELYFLDESGFEGDPKPRKEWVPRGHDPNTHYLGTHIRTNVIGAVAPKTGKLLAFTIPHVDTGVFQLFIDHLVKETASSKKSIYLVMDNATWHTTPRLRWGHITPIFLPPYSPDLNPIEQLWNHIKGNCLGNKAAKSFEELDERICQALLGLMKAPEQVQSLCKPKLSL